MTAEKVIVLDFVRIEFFENFVIAHVKEDSMIDTEHFEVFKELFTAYYEHKSYVYIADRIESYNVNPMAYINFEFSEILKGVAVVTSGKKKLLNAEFEKKFMVKPFRVFQKMDDAINWAGLICAHS